MGLLIKSDGTKWDVHPADGVKFSLRELYDLIGCDLVERVQLSEKYSIILDEEGKFKSPLVVNQEATELAHHRKRVEGDTSEEFRWRVAPNDCIVGNVVIVEEFVIDPDDGKVWR